MDDWTEVYERHGALVWATAYRILDNYAEALDCCQDVFSELIKGHTRQPVRSWAAYLKWLAARRALDRLRRRRAEAMRFCEDVDVSLLSSAGGDPETAARTAELRERFRYELTRLPTKQAEAFWLASVEDMTYEEIRAHLQVDANHVGVLIHRARKKLCEHMADLRPAERAHHT